MGERGAFGTRGWGWRAALLLVLVGAALAPIGGSRPARAAETVTFAYWGDPAESRAYERVIAEFEAANPDVDVESVYTPGQSDYQQRLATGFGGGEPPDVFLINYRRFGQYAARDALEPLGPWLDRSETLRREDFYEIPLEAFSYRGGELTCVPQNISSLVVYYNVDLFEANGVALPAADWTWEDFVATAKALTKDLDGDGQIDQHGLGVEPSLIRYAPFIWAGGGEIVDDVDNPTRLLLDSPEARAAIEWFIALGATGYNVVPSEAEVLAADDETRFMNGTTAMLLQSRRVVPTLREIEDFSWDVAALPIGPAGRAGILHSDAFCMAAASEQKEAAWRFIEYAVGPDGQTTLAATGRTVPSLKAVAESDAFLKGDPLGIGMSLPPANSRVFLDTIPDIRRVPSTSTWPEVEDAFSQAFQRAFYVEIDVEDALDVVTFTAERAFARAREEEEREG